MTHIFESLTQDIVAHDVAVEDEDDGTEERSDIEMLHGEDGRLIAVRTCAVEDQATACQLLVLLVERMQALFFPYAESSLRVLAPLASSPHEDVRSYVMVAYPELVRCVAQHAAAAPDRSPLPSVLPTVVSRLLEAVRKEGSLDLLMTALQALKTAVLYAACNWAEAGCFHQQTGEPAPLTAVNSLQVLTLDALEAVSDALKTVLRESLQRRAVMKAETQVPLLRRPFLSSETEV